MIIKKLILHRYKRFFLTGIETLTYEPDKTMQIIVSKNGAGKSSLLQELNPLPADIKRNYYEGGFKYVEIEHFGKRYILSSDKKHSMILDSQELNPGGTRKVQLELVKEHFGITPQIIDILLNFNRLTTMSLSERKRWLSEISTINYEYPISVYNKLRTQHRDLIGGIKLTENEIITLSNNILNLTQLESLKEQYKHLLDYKDHITSLYEHNINVPYDNIDYVRDTIDNIEKVTNTSKPIRDIKIIEEEYSNLEKEVTIIKQEIQNTVKVIDDLEKLNKINDPEYLKQTITDLENELGDILKDLDFELPIDKIKDYYTIYSNCLLELNPLLNSLQDYDKYRLMSSNEQEDAINKCVSLEVKLKAINMSITRIKDEIYRLNRIQSSSDISVSCPSCSSDFTVNLKDRKIKEYTRDLVKFTKNRDTVEEELETLTPIKENIYAKNDIMGKIKILIGETMTIKPIWANVLDSFNINTDSLTHIHRCLDNMLLNLERWSKASLIKIDLDKTIQELKVVETIQKENTNLHKEQLEEYRNKLDNLTKIYNEKNIQLGSLVNENNIAKSVLANVEKLYNLIDTRKRIRVNRILEERNKCLYSLREEINDTLIEMDSKIREQDSIHSNIESRNKLVEEYKKQEKILNAMVRALSPTEGLIAKSINSFLKVFVKEMNAIINKIWSYELELLPCEIGETDDLDYKFKVKVNNDQIIDDVSRLSTGMKEIVDLAFRIVFAKYKGLMEIPLYLDEFGHGFDKNHRTVAYNVIDKILSSDYPQVFIVCHYESLYGSFKNVDFNVLDGSSDVGETAFNNRLTIKY